MHISFQALCNQMVRISLFYILDQHLASPAKSSHVDPNFNTHNPSLKNRRRTQPASNLHSYSGDLHLFHQQSPLPSEPRRSLPTPHVPGLLTPTPISISKTIKSIFKDIFLELHPIEKLRCGSSKRYCASTQCRERY